MKENILLVWGYYRKDWTSLFEKTSDEFAYTYLFWVYREQEVKNLPTSGQVAYWGDFKNAYEIIESYKPAKVVFMSIDNLHTIALNYACKKRQIPTYVLQHGVYHPLADYLKLEQIKAQNKSIPLSGKGFSATQIRNFLLFFYLRTVSRNLSAWWFMLRFLLNKKRMTEFQSLQNSKSTIRLANTYIVYTKPNAAMYAERDGVQQEDMIEIGFPLMDDFIAVAREIQTVEPYYVLVDQPLAESGRENKQTILSYEQVNHFYTRLATIAQGKGMCLKIKLHPFNYKSTYLIAHNNIEYVREVNIVDLILKSSGVLGYCSSLTIAAMMFKPYCLFKVEGFTHLQDKILEWKLSPVHSYHSFLDEDVVFTVLDRQHPHFQDFFKEFIQNSDGLAWKRLATLLHN
jgi:hypothetical protein